MRWNNHRVPVFASAVALGALLAPSVSYAQTVRAPAAGELIFSEVLLRPAKPYYACEWFEMVNTYTGDDTLSLEQCRLVFSPEVLTGEADEVQVETFAPTVEDGDLQVNRSGWSEPILFAHSTGSWEADDELWLGWQEPTFDSVAYHPDFSYGGIEFKSTEKVRYTVCLICDGADGDGLIGSCQEPGADDVIVDSFSYQWVGDLEDGCNENEYGGRCAVQICEEYSRDPSANDNASLDSDTQAWRFSRVAADGSTRYFVPDDVPETFVTDTGDTGAPAAELEWSAVLGTPGRENYCPPIYNPAPGELAFSEIMGAPEPFGTAEWAELTSTDADTSINDGVRQLDYCFLKSWVYTEADTGDEGADADGMIWELDDRFLVGGTEDVLLNPGQAMVLAIDECLYAALDGADAVTANSFCPGGEFLTGLGYNSFSSDKTYALELVCPVVDGAGQASMTTIDHFQFNLEQQEGEEGVSLMLNPDNGGTAYATFNDDRNAWCPASFLSQQIDELTYTDGEGDLVANWGTPGVFSAADSPTPTCAPEGPTGGCFLSCASAGGLRGGLLLALFGLLSGLVRRRPWNSRG